MPLDPRGPLAARFDALWRHASGPTARRAVVALADQATVSGVSFATVVVIGRLAGQGSLGLYTLGLSIAAVALAVNDSFVSVPYTFYRESERVSSPRAYSGAVLLLHGVLCVAVGGVLLAASAFSATRFGESIDRSTDSWLAGLLLVLAAAAPLLLVREFARRFGYARPSVTWPLALDVSVAVLQLGGLAALALAGAVTGPSALLVMGAASGIPGATVLFLDRARFADGRSLAGDVARRHWRFGRWDLAAQVIGVVEGYAAHWLLALLRTPRETGIFAACLTVVLVTNPLILGINNVLMPRIARGFGEAGPDEVWRIVRKISLLFVVVLGAAALAFVLVGDAVVTFLFGPDYAGQRITVSLLALASIAWGVEIAVSNGLRALDRPELYFGSSLVGLVVTLGAGWPLTIQYGLFGAAGAILAGSLAETAWSWVVLLRLVHGDRRARSLSE